MSDMKFKDGKFTPLGAPVVDLWSRDHDDEYEALRAARWIRANTFGHDSMLQIQVFSWYGGTNPGEPPPPEPPGDFIVRLNTTSAAMDFVLCETYVDLMALLALWLPIVRDTEIIGLLSGAHETENLDTSWGATPITLLATQVALGLEMLPRVKAELRAQRERDNKAEIERLSNLAKNPSAGAP